MLQRTPGMTAAAALTLALGIGANTAIFSGVEQILLKPVPGAVHPQELFDVSVKDTARGGMLFSSPEYRDYRDRNDAFTGLGAYGFFPMSITSGETNERIWPMLVSGNYFDVLGVRALHGRTFLPADDAGGGQPVVVISYGLWQRRFGGRPDTVGKEIALNGHVVNIIGIAPADFYGTFAGLALDAWLPLAMQDQFSGWRRSEGRDARWLWVIGRLKRRASATQAQARLNLIARDLARTYPNTNSNLTAELHPIGRSLLPAWWTFEPLILELMGLMFLVLLIACANVANLQLSRAAARQREIAIRIALGAGRARLVRQLLTESLVLALLGGVVGLPVGIWTYYSLGSLVPAVDIPFNLERKVDPEVFLFALALTAVTGVIFGLVPALQSTRTELVSALKDDAAGAAGGMRRSRLRGSLVVAQVSLSLVLLVAAGLFLRSLQQGQTVETGFNRRNVLLSTLPLLPQGYDESQGTLFYQQLIERLEAMPGVRAATVARRVPLGITDRPSSDLVVEGYAPKAGERVWSYQNTVAPGYFRVLEVALVAGRDFSFQDNLKSKRVAIINESLAARYWPGRDPIGQRVKFEVTWLTIVGIVRDFKAHELDGPPSPFLFLPMTQFYHPYPTLLVRTTGNPASFAPAVQRVVHELDDRLPLYSVRTLDRHIEAGSFLQRIAAFLLSVFGVLALALAAVGIYGVLAYGVEQRVREIGIRMALGAQPGDILHLVLGQGARLILIGIALGIGGAFTVARLVARFLLNVTPGDALSFAGATAVLSLVAFIACYIPARRATRIEPAVALRHE